MIQCLRPYLLLGIVSDFAIVLMTLTNSFSAASIYCPMISINKSLFGSSIFLQLGCARIHSGTHARLRFRILCMAVLMLRLRSSSFLPRLVILHIEGLALHIRTVYGSFGDIQLIHCIHDDFGDTFNKAMLACILKLVKVILE
jgi:hypothetical protein